MADSVFDTAIPTCNTRPLSAFRARTASGLRIDIPTARVDSEWSDDETACKQAKELLCYTVLQELRKRGCVVPDNSYIFSTINQTEQGHLLLRWQKLCQRSHQYLLDMQGQALPQFANLPLFNKCDCSGKCNGFRCSLLNEMARCDSTLLKLLAIFHRTISASQICLVRQDFSLFDTVMMESAHTLSTLCQEEQLSSNGGWASLLPSCDHVNNGTDLSKIISISLATGLLISAVVAARILLKSD